MEGAETKMATVDWKRERGSGKNRLKRCNKEDQVCLRE